LGSGLAGLSSTELEPRSRGQLRIVAILPGKMEIVPSGVCWFVQGFLIP
jgi:hypothetical protein